jgi:hypothetical protein
MTNNQCNLLTDEVESELGDYICPVCDGKRYQLIFRVEALSNHAALVLECESCRFRHDMGC